MLVLLTYHHKRTPHQFFPFRARHTHGLQTKFPIGRYSFRVLSTHGPRTKYPVGPYPPLLEPTMPSPSIGSLLVN
jgi:hypothetical protein